MAKQSFSSGQTLTAQQMNDLQTNDFNWSVSTQTANYTLQAADKGTREVMNMSSAGTVTVPNSTFAAGDIVWVHSIGSGTISIVAGSGMTLNSSAGTAPTLAQWEGGVVYFTSASSSIFFRSGGVTSSDFSNAATGTYSSGGINYKYLTFNASGTLTVTRSGLADILVVGGGGGGGARGAGGAGGYLAITDAYLPVGTLTVTIGGGGSGGNNTGTTAYRGQGSASRLNTYWAIGGGGGASDSNLSQISTDGGSGGGGSASSGNNSAGGTGTSGQGNNGGTGAGTGGGGGGGATAVGSNGASNTGGAGGAGTSSSLDNVATTRAGGGGGGGNTTGGSASGGGGAGGTSSTAGTAGSANTGGGGGGTASTSHSGGNGGSGIVIVRVRV